LIFGLSLVAVVYTSLVALVQKDMKKLIAYSSIAHMGFVTIGAFVPNAQGLQGSIVQMISHGLISGALFLCVGVLYDRMHTKEIVKYGGIVKTMPRFALVFLFFTMASIGLPVTSGFIGEVMVLAGVYQTNPLVAACAALGVILGAAYMLWLYKRVVFGPIKNREVEKLHDLSMREWIMFLPLLLLVLLFGIYPSALTDVLHVSVEHLLQQAGGALNSAQ
jgi:NADH-quinone oxidoreductase subunit M